MINSFEWVFLHLDIGLVLYFTDEGIRPFLPNCFLTRYGQNVVVCLLSGERHFSLIRITSTLEHILLQIRHFLLHRHQVL